MRRMRLLTIALALAALAHPAAAAGGDSRDQKAALEALLQSYPVTAPAARNPLPPDILERMRAKLVELEGGAEEASDEPAPSGH